MHGRPHLTRLLVVASSATLLLVPGCSRAVDVTPAPSARDAGCTALARRLPATVDGLARRETTPSSPSTAAWGDPAVILRCGVTPPGPTTDPCAAVNDVDWVQQTLDDGVSWTTYGREPAVQVLVPKDYPPADALVDLAAAVKQIPQGERRCD